MRGPAEATVPVDDVSGRLLCPESSYTDMSRSRALLIIASLLVVPLSVAAQNGGDGASSGQTDRVTFYGHVFGHGIGGPMPANTEAPVGEDNYGIGSGTNCESATPLLADCQETGSNKLVLFSTAGPVQVRNRAEFLQDGGYSQLHNERGQTKDIVFDTQESITATVYITMDSHGWFVGNGHGTNCLAPHPPNVPCLYPYWGWDPGAYEDVVVRAQLFHAQLGDRTNATGAPPIAEAMDDGDITLIAEGQWGPERVINGLPGSPNVNQFEVDLGTAQVDTVPRSDDFFLVYTVYQETNGNNYLLRGPVRWWSGEFFPPTFTLPVQNAFEVERVIPNFAHGKLAILGVMNTPWGSYDIDPESIELDITGPNGPVTPERLSQFGDFSVAHGGHYLPINVTWIWDYNAQNLQAGTYTVTLSGANFQGSASATCQATFELEEAKGGALAPGAIEEGVCGTQTASDEFIEGIREGAEGDSQEGAP